MGVIYVLFQDLGWRSSPYFGMCDSHEIAFKASPGIECVHIPLAKASHMAKARTNGTRWVTLTVMNKMHHYKQ